MPMPALAGFDHLMLVVADPEASVAFYGRVLGAQPVTIATKMGPRYQLDLPGVRLSVQPVEPGADRAVTRAVPGAAHFCLLTEAPLQDWAAHLAAEGVAVEMGPVQRDGRIGLLDVIYFRDPDDTLVEIGRLP